MKICCSFNLVARKQIRIFFFNIVLFLTFLTVGQLSAQTDTINRNIDPKEDSENLNVLHQWLKWNNPGSLLIQHLTRQAINYYEERDVQISQLKNKTDWLNRQSIVASKLKNI